MDHKKIIIPDVGSRIRKAQEENAKAAVRDSPSNAQRFVEEVGRYYKLCEKTQETGYQVVFWALLMNGQRIKMRNLRAMTFHVILIEGEQEDATPCQILAHQTNLQILIESHPVTTESPRRSIGFFAQLDDSAQ